MLTVLRFLLLSLAAMVAAGIALLVFVAALTLEQQPWLKPATEKISAQQLLQLKQLAKRGLQGGPKPFKLSTGAAELNTGCRLLHHAYPRLHCDIDLQSDQLLITSSIEIPSNPFGRYLSWRAQLPANAQQLRIEKLQIGQLRLPKLLLNKTLPWLLQQLLGPQQSKTLFTTIRLNRITPEQLELLIKPEPELAQRLTIIVERLRQLGGTTTSIDRALISSYYQQLLEQHSQLDPQQWVSATYFIAPLLRQVHQQASTKDYHLHARAAIMALALYLGSPRIEQLLGEILRPEQRAQRPHYRTLLRGRIDLRQHFLVSAALQVLAEEGLSQAIGEFKELLDSRKGGSGFSFADLAADRAGILFARQLTRTPRQAALVLAKLNQPLREPDLMIEIDRLPEGLTEARFQALYQDLDSPHYQAVVNRIDQQLKDLRLYR